MRRLVIVLSVAIGLFGCTAIPEADIRFVDRNIPLGMSANAARAEVEQRGFSPMELQTHRTSRWNAANARLEPIPRSFADNVRLNLGLVRLEGRPDGVLSCFKRDYAYPLLFAVGERRICWTTDDKDKITWRQAGWFGASL